MMTVDRESYERMTKELKALRHENERLRASLNRIYGYVVNDLGRDMAMADAERACRELG